MQKPTFPAILIQCLLHIQYLGEIFEKVTDQFQFFSHPNYVHFEKQLLMKSKYY
jgi:hypothetical protein